ncbi:GNAT family N-acetyltransferase [Aeromonas simiae]|uniref:GNAT family N-acetyltransferase n=1 Tax=Aeromonas simiae TaxID=218936 RepID=UPI00266B6741|nr:GNAT family N-acetyltransferase [Aeromonas simiae]MDO2947826.1 GNAT family N-acetyltransferase [Aeromonas simiae]MDO2955278.1 GNAT family N-acetyltransferase [Aeromonas simiae]
MNERSGGVIRQAVAQDGAALSTLFAALGYPQEQPVHLAAQPGREVRVWAQEEGLCGVLVWHCLQPLHVTSRWGVISSLVVAPHCRGQGIGAALLADAERRAAMAGCTQMTLSSSEQRTDAHRFYERAGYRERRKQLCKWWQEGGC